MKKAINQQLITLFFVLITTSLFAQKGSIIGSVSDNNSKESIPFATVLLKSENNPAFQQGTVSDANGKFEINSLKQGNYKAIVSFIGYKSDTIEGISISKANLVADVGAISLGPSNISLNEVEVTAMANTVSGKIDRKTYRADDFGTAKGGTAVDVLNKLPSITVDPDGAVSVRGTTDFMVYLNGKPTLLEPSVLLGQISANSIESIDVITVPTARFDAQGKGGIINVTTKKSSMDGFSVSANGLLGGGPWNHVKDTYSGYDLNDNRYGAGINLSYRKEDLALYGGFNYNKRNVNGLRIGDARLLQEDGSYFHMVADGQRPEWYENYSANAGLDLKLSDNSTLSFTYFYGNRTDGRSAFYVYNNFYGDINKNPISGIDTNNKWVYNPNTDNRYGIFHSGNVDFMQKFDENSELRVSFLYEHSNLSRELDNRDYDFNKSADKVNTLERHFKQADDTPLDGYRLSIEYEKGLDNGHSIGIGFQPQLVKQAGGFTYDSFNVGSGVWETSVQFNNSIDLSRAVYAGYVDYSGSFGDLAFIAGARLEYTDQVLEIENPDYLSIFERDTKPEYEVNQVDLFPTLHLQYGLSETADLVFAASRRINRPPTKNMAPFLYRRHYEVYLVGDPELKPEYLTNYELSFDQKLGKNSVTLTGFYRGTDNAIFRVNTVYEEENVLIRSYTNSGNVKAMGAELNANLVAGKAVKFFLGASLYNFNVKGDIFGFKEDNKSTNWTLKGNMNLLITRELKFNVDVDVRSASVTTQGKNEMFYMSNAALSYAPQKMKAWDFSVKILDILSSNDTGLNTRAFDNQGVQIFYQEVEYKRQGPIVELSATYSLNMNGKTRKKADSTFGKEQF